MSGTANPIQQIQIVRDHSALKKPFAQLSLGLDFVIDTPEQDRLVQQRRAPAHVMKASSNLAVEFRGVVGVNHDDAFKPTSLQRRQPVLSDSRRYHDRQATMNANSF